MSSFINGLQAVCEGQAYDKEFEACEIVTEDEYIHMIDLKTGYLIGLSAELGAISAGANDDDAIKVREYGRLIGRAFQIQDDILDYEALKLDTGKPAMKDYKEGKITFPLFFALQNAKPKDRKFIMENLGRTKIFGNIFFTLFVFYTKNIYIFTQIFFYKKHV